MTNPINPKTGKPYSNFTMWIHKHPDKMEKQRIRGRSKIELEKSSIRTLKNREHLIEVKRLYYQNNKERLAEIARNRNKLQPKVVKAHNLSTWNYIKKDKCEICDSIDKLQTHHWNYDKPELVSTLCRTCHKIQHIKDFARWHKCKLEADKQLNNTMIIA